MKPSEAIMAFSQSEKIKSGLIWISQSLEISNSTAGQEKQGAERIIKALLSMILHEIQLAKNVSGMGPWDDIEKDIDRAIIMIDSGVGPESVLHLTQALSKVTTVGQNSMTLLQEERLL
jgi:hypothetical protein